MTILTNIDSNKCTYSEILFQISEKQKELLIILAKAGKARAVTSGKYHLLSTSSVHSALRGCWRRILLPKSRAYTRCTTALPECGCRRVFEIMVQILIYHFVQILL